MKKLLGILFFILISAYTFAQTKTAVSHTMRSGDTYYEYTPKAAEYMGGTATLGYDTLYFEVLANKNGPVNCNVRVELTVVGTTDTYDIDLQGKVFENGTYAALIESATNSATKELSDTTSFGAPYDALPAAFYRYYRIIINNDNARSAGDSAVIDKVIFKFYER